LKDEPVKRLLFAIAKHHFIIQKRGMQRRAVSEIIATLLLMAVTVVGGILAMVMVTGFTNNSQFNNVQTPEELELVGYDTRDGPDLSGIGNLDNKKDTPPRLCTNTGCVTPNNTPINGGTEFIVITLHNPSSKDIYLSTISVSTDSIAHEWDSLTAGDTLDASTNNPGNGYPAAGKYSIIPEDGLVQQSDTKIVGSGYVRVVIKLSNQITQTIDSNAVIPIIVSTNTGATFKFFVTAGSIK
jgi:flagellin-like protein